MHPDPSILPTARLKGSAHGQGSHAFDPRRVDLEGR